VHRINHNRRWLRSLSVTVQSAKPLQQYVSWACIAHQQIGINVKRLFGSLVVTAMIPTRFP